MRSLDAVTFDAGNLVLEGEEGNLRQWHTADGDFVSLNYYSGTPDLGGPLADIEKVRTAYRETAVRAGGASVEVDPRVIDDCQALRTILKILQQPKGVIYIGALTLPFRDFSYLVKAQCAETGTTGMRDATVFTIMMQKGEISFDQDGTPDNWMRDPYDPAISLPFMRNHSEDPAYDADFPGHPLSRARDSLRHLERTVHVAPALKSEAKFEG
jgi:hypothetical protein